MRCARRVRGSRVALVCRVVVICGVLDGLDIEIEEEKAPSLKRGSLPVRLVHRRAGSGTALPLSGVNGVGRQPAVTRPVVRSCYGGELNVERRTQYLSPVMVPLVARLNSVRDAQEEDA